MTVQETMRNHWWWRPGWRVGRKMYTWHVTFEGQDSLYSLVAAYQTALKGLPGLDLIPPRWLHLTMQGVGFTDEVGEDNIRAIVQAAQARCQPLAPFESVFGPPKVDPEAIMFALHPAAPARAVRAQIRTAIADVWGTDNVPEAADWDPHVSIAYSNATGPATPYIDALSQVSATPAKLLVRAVELIVLNRDNQMYEWDTFAIVPLNGS